MGLIECASGNSVWRGIDYFEAKKVKKITQTSESEFEAEVSGSDGAVYHVLLNIDHPRKSICNCPHADGRRVICKHIIATYFTRFPNAYEKFMKEVEEYEAQEEEREEEEIREIEKYVNSLSKAELQKQLLEYMLEERYQENWYR